MGDVITGKLKPEYRAQQGKNRLFKYLTVACINFGSYVDEDWQLKLGELVSLC